MSKELQALISALLHRTPALRLGARPQGMEEVCAHPWFQDIDWNALERKDIPPPPPPPLVTEGAGNARGIAVADHLASIEDPAPPCPQWRARGFDFLTFSQF